MDTVTELLAEQRRLRPKATAVRYLNQRWTFGELDDAARRVATGLARLGVRRGDRVALWLPNTPAYLAISLACARIGAIAVAVNTRFRSVEVGDIVGRSGARVMIMWPGFRAIDFLSILSDVVPGSLERLETIVLYHEGVSTNVTPRAIEHCQRVTFERLLDEPPMRDDHATPDSGCNIFTTSGTTKAPKFVLHNQASIAQHARTMARGLGYVERPGSVLQAVPLCGVFGFCQATAAIAAGQPLTLMNAFDVDAAVSLIAQHDIRYFNGTDDMIDPMLDAASGDVAFPSVDYVGFASFAAKPDVIIEKAEARGLKLAGLYGMSEVQAFFARQPIGAPVEQRQLGGGTPLAGSAAIRVRNPDTGQLLGPGESGEIELRGPSLMSEYFQNPTATAEAFTDDGYLRSGDLGYLTTDGGFVFQTRIGDVLRLGGFLVSPLEIETHLNLEPAISGAQVVGIDTPNGPRPFAFVTLHPGATFDEARVRDHCLHGLAKFKAPIRIVALDEFPTTKSANATKIQRTKLREMAEAAIK